MKRTKIMALLLAFCLAVPSPMATLAADTSTTPTIEGTTGTTPNSENGGVSKDKENGETKDADQDGKQEGNSQSADGKSTEENSGNSNSVNGDSQNDKNGSGDSESKDSENKDSANGNSGENSNSQTGENLAKSGNSENKPVQMNGTGYDTIQAAIEAIEENGSGTIIVTGSEELTENITIPSGKTVNLYGGKLTGNSSDDNTTPVITNKGTLTLQSTEVVATNQEAISNQGTMTLYSCSVSTTSMTESCIESGNQGTTTYRLTIHGGKIEGDKYVIKNNSGTVTIDGAEVVGRETSSSVIYNSGALIITSGTFTKKNTNGSLITKSSDAEPDATVQISGGTFSDSINETWLANGFEQKAITTGDTTVYQIVEKPVVAYIGNTNYTSIQEAVRKAQLGDTITLRNGQDAITLDSTIYVGKKITLDLNGVTVQSADVLGENSDQGSSDGSLFHVTEDGSLTLKDSTAAEKPKVENNTEVSYNSGKLKSTNTARTGTGDQVACISVSNGGAFILESGQLESNSYGVYKYTNEQTWGTININGGYINAADTAVYVTRCADVKVTDGVLKSENSVIVGDENSNFEISGGYLITAAEDDSTCYGIVKEGKGNIRFTGGNIYVKNGYGIVMVDGVLTMNGGTIRTEGTVNSNVAGMDQCYGILLVDGGKYDDKNNYNKFGFNVGDDETNTFYAEISGGKIVAPNSVEAIKTAVPEDKNCSEKTIGGIVVKKASSGFAPAFSSAVNANYCYIEKDAELDKTITQLAPTDNRKGQAGVDDDAPYSVDNRVWMRFVGDGGTTDISGAAGNKVDSDTENKQIANELKATIPQKDASSSDKVNVFLGWYEAEAKQDGKEGYEKKNGAVRVNLDDILTVIPAEDITYLPVFMEVDKGTATGEAELQGTALPKDTTTAGQTALETMSKAVKSAAEKLAKAVKKDEADTVLVSITVDANKKTRDEVSADADKIQETLASNETIQGYYDVSLTQTTYKASYTDASADVTVAAENGAGTELKPTQTTVSAALHELDTKIPVTLDMDPEYLQNRQLRVVEVHDGKVLDLEYTFDSENNLMTVQMDKFSTVAVVSATYTTVTFDSMGGSDVGKENVSYGNKVTKPADPTRSGYKFLGWYTEKAYKNAYGFDVSVTDMTPFTLYAKWEAVSTDNQDKDKDKNNSNSNSGSSSGSKSSSSSSSVSSANTGDQAAPALWLFVLVLAGAGAAGTGYYFRKKRQ